LHGDLLFAGAEQVLRIVERDSDEIDAAILEVSRIDDINDAARDLLAGMRTTLTVAGKEGYLVDPDGKVVRADRQQVFDAVVFRSLDDAVGAAERFRRG
jgi:glutaminase